MNLLKYVFTVINHVKGRENKNLDTNSCIHSFSVFSLFLLPCFISDVIVQHLVF